MSYENIQKWSDLQIQDLLLAYRKCKADCFYERSLYATEAFVQYEASLWENLRDLLDNLRLGNIAQVLSSNLGTPRIFAKKLGLEASDRPVDGHRFFSDADRNFERLRDTWRLRSTMSAVSELERAVDGGPCKINGIKVEHSAIDLWTDLRAWILASCRDAVVRSWPWNTATGLSEI
jgi:hypothetical protein